MTLSVLFFRRLLLFVIIFVCVALFSPLENVYAQYSCHQAIGLVVQDGSATRGGAVGYNITSNSDGSLPLTWNNFSPPPSPPNQWYQIGRWVAGVNGVLTLTNPNAGYDCTWMWTNAAGIPPGSLWGSGCTAQKSINGTNGSCALNENHVWFVLESQPNMNAPVCNTIAGLQRVTLSWDPIPMATAYVVRINGEPYGSWIGGEDIRDMSPSDTSTSRDYWVTAGTRYKWGVQSIRVEDLYPYKTRHWDYPKPDSTSVGFDGVEFTCNPVPPPFCGDGPPAVPPEQCDDGNTAAGDGCSPTCRREECGNGLPLDPGEQCDDGNTTSGDGCSSTCQNEICGDGPPLDAGEQCDDGNTIRTDECDTTALNPNTNGVCTWTFCGDGTMQIDNGANNGGTFGVGDEECDDGNSNNTDACTNLCTNNAAAGMFTNFCPL